MLRGRVFSSIVVVCHSTLRPKSDSYKNRKDAKRAAVENLFRARDGHQKAAGAAELANRANDREGGLLRDARVPSHLASKPVTFLDLEPTAEPGTLADLADSRRADAEVQLVGDDSEFSVLTDDAYSYFPEDATRSEEATAIPGGHPVPRGMRRYRLELQFRGDHFLGWNRGAEMRRRRTALGVKRGEISRESDADNNLTWAGHALGGLRSAKDAIDEALSVALDTPNINVVAGSTLETGVNARRLTCHVDIPAELEMQPRTVLLRAHAWLRQKSDPLGILTFERAPPNFHARHAKYRSVYVYRMLNRIAPPLFETGNHWHVDRFLDEEKMAAVAEELLQGTRDFGCFADTKIARAVTRGGTTATVRTLDEIRVTRQEDEVHIWFVGGSFLRHSIRNMVGVLRFVGQGRWAQDHVRMLLDRGFDEKGGASILPPIAPAHGLTLWDVQYPAEFGNTRSFTDAGPLELDPADLADVDSASAGLSAVEAGLVGAKR
jgi:tRNA pseudouridine(38-40) synthase